MISVIGIQTGGKKCDVHTERLTSLCRFKQLSVDLVMEQRISELP